MNTKSAFLYAIMIAVTACFAAQPAKAEEGGARFRYAPNIYASEKPRVPHSYARMDPEVPSGHVPRSPSFLGVDPTMLRPPTVFRPMPAVAPIARPQVAANPSFTSAVPQLVAPQFKAQFGQPLSSQAPNAMASLPQSMPPPPMAGRPNQPVKSSVSGKLRPSIAPSFRGMVSGRLKHPTVARSAGSPQQLPPVENYGGMGYSSGPLLPSFAGGTGRGANTSVTGHVVRQH